ncbi:MAG TPA: helix-hairpin-helix domain-containing protein, partial [Nitrososphaeraceae archaeon]
MKKNSDISKTLRQIAFLLEMDYDNDASNSNSSNKSKKPHTSSSTTINFKARSYRKASDIIANLSSNIEELYRKEGLDGLLQIPAVGKAIAAKIEEYLTTGKIQYF